MAKKLTPEQKIRKRFKGRAKFRVVGSERAGYKLVIRDTTDKTMKQLEKMESTLEKAFDVEIVNFA